jgi:hypothetical protein
LCKERAQPIRNESYPHLPSEPIRDEADYITKIRAAKSRKRNAVKSSQGEKVAKKPRVSITVEKKMEVIC